MKGRVNHPHFNPGAYTPLKGEEKWKRFVGEAVVKTTLP